MKERTISGSLDGLAMRKTLVVDLLAFLCFQRHVPVAPLIELAHTGFAKVRMVGIVLEHGRSRGRDDAAAALLLAGPAHGVRLGDVTHKEEASGHFLVHEFL